MANSKLDEKGFFLGLFMNNILILENICNPNFKHTMASQTNCVLRNLDRHTVYKTACPFLLKFGAELDMQWFAKVYKSSFICCDGTLNTHLSFFGRFKEKIKNDNKLRELVNNLENNEPA